MKVCLFIYGYASNITCTIYLILCLTCKNMLEFEDSNLPLSESLTWTKFLFLFAYFSSVRITSFQIIQLIDSSLKLSVYIQMIFTFQNFFLINPSSAFWSHMNTFTPSLCPTHVLCG